jgi:hypothetical protein
MDNDDEHDVFIKLPTYKRSPYYQHFHSIIEEAVQGDAQTDGETNIYHIPRFMAYLEEQHTPYLPMLNGRFVKDFVNQITKLLTNNYVEKWFSLVS